MKILLLDIETSPNIGYTWGKWEQDVIAFIEHWKILCIGYKWLGKPTKVLALPDVGGSEIKLLKHIHSLLDEADVIIAQNGDAFDFKKINTRFIQFKIDPPSPYKTVDTLKVARDRFAFNSNKLDDLGKDLSEGEKLKHRGFEMWKGCMAGDKKSWSEMKRYNKKDVDLLERIYLRFRPWILRHPNMSHNENVCPKCGETSMIYQGYSVTASGRYRRLKCTKCAGWGQVKIASASPHVVNA